MNHLKTEILARLERGRDALLEALDGVDLATAQQRPGADRWSILQCVEHLASRRSISSAGSPQA